MRLIYDRALIHAKALGPEPEREALEGILLLLVGEGKMTMEGRFEVRQIVWGGIMSVRRIAH